MERYGGLTDLGCQMRDDPDVAYVNLEDDLFSQGINIDLCEIEDEVRAIMISGTN